MEYRIEEIGNATVIRLKGSFDRSARGKMEIELLSLVNFGSHLIFDFTEVDFISSAGLHLLLDLHRRCEGQHADMVLTGLSEQIRNLLAMTGFAPGVLSVYDTLEDGLAAIRSKPEPDGSKRGFDKQLGESAYYNN